MMKIQIKLEREEVKGIIKSHILKILPMAFDSKIINVFESYGTFTVDIAERIEAPEEVKDEAIDDVSSDPVFEGRDDNLE